MIVAGRSSMSSITEVSLRSAPFDCFSSLIGPGGARELTELAKRASGQLHGRTWWHINSTSRGGGVAEMLQSQLAYARGLGIHTRWLVLGGHADFFKITKRMHHAFHGALGDGSDLGEKEQAIYDATLKENILQLLPLIKPGDIVLLHDPQSAGLAPALVKHGATVLWRSHIGADVVNEHTDLAWHFVGHYLRHVFATVFSRKEYIPEFLKSQRSFVITPSIDAFSPKNQNMDEKTVKSILVHTGLIRGEAWAEVLPRFTREDGTPALVTSKADIVREGTAPGWETPLIVQVSRWDPLKDPVGVIRGFVNLILRVVSVDAHLALVGPDVTSVTDDPEGRAVLDSVIGAWKVLPAPIRQRIHLVSLPMEDREENAAIVNAIQRHAAIIVQKSLKEGFGLTVTEAMWKGRPVVASAVGGIQDQIVHGQHGLLLTDPHDELAFSEALEKLSHDQCLATRLGVQATERVRDLFLTSYHLEQYARVLDAIDSAQEVQVPANVANHPLREVADEMRSPVNG
ncbi:glycosyltransferase [Dyella psychrodurans]|uniref:Glycosyltransferase n=2 Tax=Dyella psychrodurans TaxID=1927960 RepID=A0A370X316_9GAMM|nr:glycosyltransferase [Dyella psychrodurans]